MSFARSVSSSSSLLDYSELNELLENTMQQIENLGIEMEQDNHEREFRRMQLDVQALCSVCSELEEEVWSISNQCASVQKKYYTMSLSDNIQGSVDELNAMCDAVCESIVYTIGWIGSIREDASDLNNQCVAFDWVALREQCSEAFDLVEVCSDALNSRLTAMQSIQTDLNYAVAATLESSRFECPICMMELSKEDLFIVSTCNHEFCRACAQGTINSNLNSGEIPLVCPQCKAEPCSNCPVKKGAPKEQGSMHCELVQCDLETLLDPKDLERYNRAQISNAVNTSGGELVRCPAENCGNVVARSIETCHCICDKCFYEWCEDCHTDWHSGSTCAQYQEWKNSNEQADELLEKLKGDGTVKKCPHCQMWGSMGPGECNSTMCLHCKKSFCWLCGISLAHLKDPHSHFGEAGKCYGKVFHGVH